MLLRVLHFLSIQTYFTFLLLNSGCRSPSVKARQHLLGWRRMTIHRAMALLCAGVFFQAHSMETCAEGVKPSADQSEYLFRMVVFGAGESISYSVQAYPSGLVEYEGYGSVKTIGKVQFRVDQETLSGLRADFQNLGFFALDAVYQEPISSAHRNRRGIQFEMRSGEIVKVVMFYQLVRGGSALQKVNDLLAAARSRIPIDHLRCPYVVRWPDRSAGFELCSGRQVISREEWASRIKACMSVAGDTIEAYVACSGWDMFTQAELEENVKR